MSDTNDTLGQLAQARLLCLRDPGLYSQVIPRIQNVFGPNTPLNFRRWGSDFLAESFASPVLPADEKEKLSLLVLDTLKGYLDRRETMGEDEDPSIVKSAIQCAASVYPLILRHAIDDRDNEAMWSKMTNIKLSILQRMDSAPAGVRICCIKFVAQVVQVQTPGLIADPRRPEKNEISLALVPRDHPFLSPSILEAEASGLLDRLLGVLQDNDTDALVVTATLNSLSSLVQRRATVAVKILTTVLNFNPIALVRDQPLKGKEKIAVKSMTRTTISFLLNVFKRNPSHPLAGRLQQRTEQLRQALSEAFVDGISGKRKPEPDDSVEGLEDAKRRCIKQETVNSTGLESTASYPLPQGPVTLAQLFTLNESTSTNAFHVELLPPSMMAQVLTPLLQTVDPKRLVDAVNATRHRYLDLERDPPASLPGTTEGDEDEYDPSAELTDEVQEASQVMPMLPQNNSQGIPSIITQLKAPPPINNEERRECSQLTVQRVFETLAELDKDQKQDKGGKRLHDEHGFGRIASLSRQREWWVTLLTRLATRAPFELSDKTQGIKQENHDRDLVRGQNFDLADYIRNRLSSYIMDDWRRRLDVAVAWLNEEWYSDCLAHRFQQSTSMTNGNKYARFRPLTEPEHLPNYMRWSISLLRQLTLYLDARESRYLIRFLSEMPHLTKEHLEVSVGKIAEDPERVGAASQAILYLCMFRPPVRDVVLNVAVDIWRGMDEEGRNGAMGKVIQKWRPDILQERQVELKVES
ncbi:hypothetical protein M433DRAFT_159016 [Acidomyces richmondensis BFW]|nr:MAG: hypothetical protein FE78DRAFT_86502 [Acidomyces sp. 'richmondensis']KYG41448.1 hypothetical protein M433DRAFT_159016 [Acidomyces richmondensis BFW]